MPRKTSQPARSSKSAPVSGRADADQTDLPPAQSDVGNMEIRDVNEQVAAQIRANEEAAAAQTDGEPFRPKK